jgi:hypothetical protein
LSFAKKPSGAGVSVSRENSRAPLLARGGGAGA